MNEGTEIDKLLARFDLIYGLIGLRGRRRTNVNGRIRN